MFSKNLIDSLNNIFNEKMCIPVELCMQSPQSVQGSTESIEIDKNSTDVQYSNGKCRMMMLYNAI